jgi:hypothetical protein
VFLDIIHYPAFILKKITSFPHQAFIHTITGAIIPPTLFGLSPKNSTKQTDADRRETLNECKGKWRAYFIKQFTVVEISADDNNKAILRT